MPALSTFPVSVLPNPRTALVAALFTGAILGLCACHTVNGAKEDLTIAGKATSNAADNAGKAISNTAENVKQGL